MQHGMIDQFDNGLGQDFKCLQRNNLKRSKTESGRIIAPATVIVLAYATRRRPTTTSLEASVGLAAD